MRLALSARIAGQFGVVQAKGLVRAGRAQHHLAGQRPGRLPDQLGAAINDNGQIVANAYDTATASSTPCC